MDDVSFSLHYGEIVGIAGVQGNGQTELVDIISGMNTEYKGRILLGIKVLWKKLLLYREEEWAWDIYRKIAKSQAQRRKHPLKITLQ